MKIALVHDRLCALGGSERVFQFLCEAFPKADVYTLTYDRKATLEYFASRKIQTTWLDPFVRSPRVFRIAFPLATRVMERMKLAGYDVVLSSSATVAKYVTVVGGRHICYCYIPTRAIWHADAYFNGGTRGKLFHALLPYLRRHDYAAAQKVDQFIAISEMSRGFIREYYNRESEVIPCPIDLRMFYASTKRDFYLLVSRLEHWKRVDYAVEAFNRLELPLHIIGTGEEEGRLRAMAKPNIKFLGAVDDNRLARAYAEALAVVFTPHLEYGLIPLEANASGTPAICYGHGGVWETMVPIEKARPGEATAVFFDEQSADSLCAAIQQFQSYKFHPDHLVRHARGWGVPAFQQRIRETVAAAACRQPVADYQ